MPMNRHFPRALCLVALLFLLLGSAPYAQNAEASRPRNAAPAEATLTLNEAFFNVLLETVFRDFDAPAYPLSLAHAQCLSEVKLAREAEGVKTSVRLTQGSITAPIAFTGSYKPPFGCLRFQGWAETEMALDFNQTQQTLNLRVTVRKIHLSNIPDFAAAPVAGLVQKSLDERVNPLPLLNAAQLAAQFPIAALGGTLQLRAREVRPEIASGELRLHIVYEFSRVK